MGATTGTEEAAVVLRCARCGQKNRVLRARLADGPVCGACHGAVLPTAPVAGTDASWQDEVEASPLPVLVDFWAPWCGPCRAVAPVLDRVAAERAGRLKVVKINVDENPRTAARFGVQSIPTLLVVRDGRVVDEMRGALPKPALDARLDRIV
jgi:thioredoxin 2